MKTPSWLAVIAAPIIAFTFAATNAHAVPECTPIPETSFEIDGISNLDAAIVNPSSPLTGFNIVATGCDIGVYFSPGTKGTVNNSTVTGAQKAGIVNNGGNVKVDSNSVYQIGDNPLDGVQYGFGIYFDGQTTRAAGSITNNTVWNYQKNGIVVRYATSRVTIKGNTVIGQGPVTFIASNGIEAGFGATVAITNNNVFGNSYSGSNLASASGVILFGGPCYGGPDQTNTQVSNNALTGNDVGVWLNNLAANCINSDSTTTRNSVSLNTIRDNGIFNTTGGPIDGSSSPVGAYQAGVSDQGRSDTILANSICGVGYTPQSSTPPYLFSVDTSLAISPLAFLNFCF